MPTLTINIANAGTAVTDSNGVTQPSLTGHMWYSLDAGNGSLPSSFGFAPDEDHQGWPLAPGNVYKNDNASYQGDRYYTRTIEITQDQYDQLIAYGGDPTAFGFSTYYNGLTNSCIDFVWKALEVAGLNASGFQGALWPTWNREYVDQALSAYANPSGTSLIDDGQGNTITASYDDEGNLTGYSWQTVDGSHGTDTLNVNGSRFGEVYNPDGTYSTYSSPGNGSQTLFQALNNGTLIDALSLLRAIQSGDPLPVVASGLRVASSLDSLDGKIDSIGLNGAANIAGGALSLLSLRNALDRGDTFAAITAGAQFNKGTHTFSKDAIVDACRDSPAPSSPASRTTSPNAATAARMSSSTTRTAPPI